MYSNFGIHLSDQKKSLVAGRLAKRIRVLGYSSFSEYLLRLRNEPAELSELIDNLSTNHTYFFRESAHFQYLDEHLLAPMASDPVASPPRIWCAGCASGEEAYTLAMFVRNRFGARALAEPAIVATDISLPALQAALRAEYPESKLREVPADLLSRSFERIGPDSYRVTQELRRLVLFKRLNLMDERYPFHRQFHAILCRNVMIYFDQESRRKLINSFHRWLLPGGYFFLGHSETISRGECPFEYVKPAVYRKAEE
jgi:chemotaxis protein methyltransferase CheR